MILPFCRTLSVAVQGSRSVAVLPYGTRQLYRRPSAVYAQPLKIWPDAESREALAWEISGSGCGAKQIFLYPGADSTGLMPHISRYIHSAIDPYA